VSLYSGKARSYLRRRGVPFEEILSTRAVVNGFVAPTTGLRMVPVVQFPDGSVVQDTTAIIDRFEFGDERCYPVDPVRRFVSLLLEVFGDEWLLMPAMHYRWAYKRKNMPLVLREFGELVAPELPRAAHFAAGVVLAAYFGGGYGPFLGIDAATRPAIEHSYEEFLDEFEAHLQQHDFLLGDRPSIGDFGFIAPLYAHLYRDPAPGELMRRRAPGVARWVERMIDADTSANALSAEHEGSPTDVPSTLLPLLRRFFGEFGPIMTACMDAIGDWTDAHPDAPRLPRTVGRHAFEIDGAASKRMAQTFTQWMWQRPLYAYLQLHDKDRTRADKLLAATGGTETLAARPRAWLRRVNNRLVVADFEAMAGPGGANAPAPTGGDLGSPPEHSDRAAAQV